MKLHSLLASTSVLLSLPLLFVKAPRVAAQSNTQAASQSSFVQTPAVPARITQAIVETQLVRLKDHVHALARPEFDQGPVPDSTPVRRALLLLQRSEEQETALRKLLDEQQIKDSPNFHQWLTPQQFGAQFGLSDSDIQTLTDWLIRQGFHDVKVGVGRTTIEFSGNVGQVRNAFHTEVHKFNVRGEAHIANASDPQIPAALSPVISRIVGLHDFRPKSLLHKAENFHREKVQVVGKTPSVTFTSGCGPSGTSPCYAVAPADFAKIYNVPATVAGNPPGTGVTIAIVQDSNLNVSDVQQFRTLFGLSSNFSTSNVVLNGPDPGVQDPNSVTGDEMEADLDVELAGAVAPGATIDLVVSENPDTLGAAGIDLSALYILDNNLAPILSESFGVCETGTGVFAFYNSLWEQAAAEGITVLISTGDSGSDVCDSNNGLDFATTGLSNSGLASTPFNVALGGTDLQNGPAPSPFWSVPGTTTESAKSYIPESTWNSSCAAGATSATLNSVCTATIINQNSGTLLDLTGGSGGESAVSTNVRPSWQTGITPAADALRDIPDISLFSAVNTSNNSFYIICEADSPTQKGNACSLTGTVEITPLGGTSAAAPAFAGIMASVIQQQGGQRQGNANHVLYNLYRKNLGNASTICASNAANVSATGCIFYDVITGNNSVACAGGSPNCSNTNAAANQYGVLVDPASTTTPAFGAVPGFDKATGLGSVNVGNLLTNWSSASLASDTTAITASPSATIAHGSSANFTVQVTQGSGAVVPTGDVSLIATPTGGQPFAIGTFNNSTSFALSASGTATISTNLLPGGTDSVVAQYSGDGTFAPSQSPAITVTVSPEASKTAVSMWTFGAAGTVLSNNATTAVYGSPYVLRVDVTNSSGTQCSGATVVPCPTGKVAVTDNGAPLNDFSSPNSTLPAGTTTLNNLGFAEDQPVQLPGGTHTLQAAYAGDTSFAGSTSATDTVMITAAPTTTTVGASPASGVTTTTAVTLTATIATASSGIGPTGTVTFSAGGTTLGTANVVGTAASGLNTNSPVPASGTATLTHTFATAGTYSVSASYSTADTNYANSASSGTGNATVTVAGSGIATTTVVISSTMTLPAGGGSVTLTATVTGTGTGASPTGTVQFMNGSTALGAAQTCTAVSGTTPQCAATLTTTLSFLAPPAGPNRTPSIRGIPWMPLASLALVVLLLLGLQRVPKPYRRAYACASLLLLAGLVAGLAAGCGSSYGGGGGGGVHYDSITAVYSGDATYAGSTSPAITVTVQ